MADRPTSRDNPVVLVTVEGGEFGTGFVAYTKGGDAYVVTCEHVLRARTAVEVNGHPCEIVALGSASNVDLAVLRVPGLDADPLPLALRRRDAERSTITVRGFRSLGGAYELRTVEGVLPERTLHRFRNSRRVVESWTLAVTGENGLLPGYSGAPVLEDATGRVVGVVTYREGGERRGIAVSIAELAGIWPELIPVQLESAEARLQDAEANLPMQVRRIADELRKSLVAELQAILDSPAVSMPLDPAEWSSRFQPPVERATMSLLEWAKWEAAEALDSVGVRLQFARIKTFIDARHIARYAAYLLMESAGLWEVKRSLATIMLIRLSEPKLTVRGYLGRRNPDAVEIREDRLAKFVLEEVSAIGVDIHRFFEDVRTHELRYATNWVKHLEP